MNNPAAIKMKPADPVHQEQRLLTRPMADSLVDRLKAGLGQRLRGWAYGTLLYEWRLKGRHPLKLLGSPDDPWPGNPQAGDALLAGYMVMGDDRLEVDDPAFWPKAAQKPALRRYAFGFHWLRDLAHMVDQKRARTIAERLMRGWLARYHRYHFEAWTPVETAQRLGFWLLHAPLILSSDDLVYRSAVLNATARQARHLARVAGDSPSGAPLVDVAGGLILCGLYLPHGMGLRAKGEALLRRALAAFVLADGGVMTRCPDDVLSVMKSLIIVRDAYMSQQEEPLLDIQHALDRMAPFLRALRHEDGRLAHINGGGAEPLGLVSRILDRSGTTGQALDYAPYSGLMRMKARGLLVLFDAMPPAPSGRDMRGHAGALSFELADGGARIVTNIGPVPDGAKILAPDMAALVRTTAAHSTLVVDNRNSTELRDGVLGDGVNSIEISRSQSADGLSISARHDGYRRRLKLDHRRSLTMSARGDKLEGCDELLPQGRIPRGGIDFDLRFHLHPRITASVTQGGSAVLLRLSDRHGWLFRLEGGSAELEDSLYMQEAVPLQSQQIVVKGTVRRDEACKILWQFERLGAAKSQPQSSDNATVLEQTREESAP